MSTNYKDLKRSIALVSDGRFIPYIGDHYDYGLGPDKGDDEGENVQEDSESNPRILIIGPRHYCDASYSSRNLLAYLSEDMRDKLIGNPNATFPSDLRVGCVMDSPKDCLKTTHDKCPVYLAKGKTCPLWNRCEIRQIGMEEGGLHCGKVRNLRCETLFAVHEYLNKPSIESARLGLTYFDSIAKFLIDEFNYASNKKHVAKDIWGKVAFMNLIQRYIPLKDTNFDSKTIRRFIEDDDIFFCKKKIINNLKPDYIIMTMPCIEEALRTIIINEYTLHKAYRNRGWYLYKKNNAPSIATKWELRCDEFLKDYKLPATSIALGEEIYNLVNVFSSDILTAGEPSKNRVKIVRTKILEILWKKLKTVKTPPSYIKSIKCLNYNLDLAQGESIMRKWISNAHNGICNKSNLSRHIEWTIDTITIWLNENR